MRIVTTENQRYLGEWLVRILNFPLPETTQCIGQLKDGNLVAVAGYTNFMPKACEIHIGSVWVSIGLVKILYGRYSITPLINLELALY